MLFECYNTPNIYIGKLVRPGNDEAHVIYNILETLFYFFRVDMYIYIYNYIYIRIISNLMLYPMHGKIYVVRMFYLPGTEEYLAPAE